MTFADFERLAVEQSQRTFTVEDLIRTIRNSRQVVDQSVIDLLNRALSRPRQNQSSLTQAQKAAFNNAVQAAEADGSYALLAAIHLDMSHQAHSIMGGGYVGGMRFLPWHRVYCAVLESQLQVYEPDVMVPYWDWANDHELPGWVYKPPGVTRSPGPAAPQGGWPIQPEIDGLITNHPNDYPGFTLSGLQGLPPPRGLESIHNAIHNWCGGTMQDPMAAPQDPVFWLHHANVDRIWTQWQAMNPGVMSPLTGRSATLDPWWTTTIRDAQDTYSFRYYYV
jgi:hypothetical protein